MLRKLTLICAVAVAFDPGTNVRRARQWIGKTTYWPRMAPAVRCGADGTSVRGGAAPNGVTPVGMAVPDGVGTGGVVAGGEVMG